MQLDGFSDRVALVTGAAGGIGRRICETFAAQGAHVAGMDLEAPQIPGVLGVATDVTDGGAVDGAFGRVEDEFGNVQILVLNAGIFIVEPFEQTSREHWDRTLADNPALSKKSQCGAISATRAVTSSCAAARSSAAVRTRSARRSSVDPLRR